MPSGQAFPALWPDVPCDEVLTTVPRVQEDPGVRDSVTSPVARLGPGTPGSCTRPQLRVTAPRTRPRLPLSRLAAPASPPDAEGAADSGYSGYSRPGRPRASSGPPAAHAQPRPTWSGREEAGAGTCHAEGTSAAHVPLSSARGRAPCCPFRTRAPSQQQWPGAPRGAAAMGRARLGQARTPRAVAGGGHDPGSPPAPTATPPPNLPHGSRS